MKHAACFVVSVIGGLGVCATAGYLSRISEAYGAASLSESLAVCIFVTLIGLSAQCHLIDQIVDY